MNEAGRAPKILIVHTLEWSNAARMALAFRSIGCNVYALCRRGHQLRAISSLKGVFTLNPFARIRSLRSAIRNADPDLIVPCDDTAVVLLHQLYRQEKKSAKAQSQIPRVIERSLGRPENYQTIATRSMLPGLADLANVLLPQTESIPNLGALRGWCARNSAGVLKTDHSWAGWGVRIFRNYEEAEGAFRAMTGAPYYTLAIKRLLWDRDPELFLRLLRGQRPALTVQTFIQGVIANSSAACWEGEVIANIGVEVVATQCPTGNATVVRVVDNHDMNETAARIIRQIGSTGIVGFDFILEKDSGRAFLLEVNPRATQITHLALGKGRDLAAAIRARLLSEPVPDSRAITDGNTIALFPQELRRDPESVFLGLAYHDMPHEEPALVRAFLAKPGRLRRFVAWVRTIQLRPVLGSHAQGEPARGANATGE